MHFPEFQIIGKYVYFPIKHFKSGHENTKHHYSLFSIIQYKRGYEMLYLFLKIASVFLYLSTLYPVFFGMI